MTRPSHRPCLIARFARDARGAVSILAALLIVLALGLSVLVVDAGHLYLAKRRLQSAVDAAALAAAGDNTQAAALASAALTANGYDGGATVETGTYTADPALAQSARFVPSAGGNAVRVTKTITTPSFLGGIFGNGGDSSVKASALAARIPAVAFAAGTGLGDLSGGQINQVLGGLFGAGLNLTLPNYAALASANVDALTFLDQLAAQAGVTAGTYGDLADTSVTVGQVLSAAQAALNIQGGDNTAALDALNMLSLQLPQSAAMTFGQVADTSLWQQRRIGSVVQQNSGQTNFNLFDIIAAMARIYGAGHLVSASGSTTLPLAGAVTITTNMVVGSPMTSVGLSPKGTTIATQQVRVAITVKTNPLAVGADSPVRITLPVYLRLAGGTATVTGIPCTADGTRAVITAAVQTGFAAIGSVSDADLKNLDAEPVVAPAQLASVSLLHLVNLTITAAGNMDILPGGPTPLPFDAGQIKNGTPQTVAGTDNQHIMSGLVGVLYFPPQSGTLLGIALNLLNNTVLPAVKPILVDILTALDPATDTLLRATGLRLGAIDVVVRGVRCGTPTLVH
jgi:uncharacterized membrane protein